MKRYTYSQRWTSRLRTDTSCLSTGFHLEFFPSPPRLVTSSSACRVPRVLAAMSKTPRSRWGPVRSLLVLAPLFIAGPFYAYRAHYGKSSAFSAPITA